jgi:hypothetical protein
VEEEFMRKWLLMLVIVAIVNFALGCAHTSAVDTTSTDPAWYYASAIQIGGEGSTIVSRSVNTNSQVEPNQPVISESEYDRYMKISYNTPKDIMWLGCGKGYKIDPKSAFSSTGNDIIKEDFGYGIRLINLKNHLVILCRKAS